MPEPLHASSAQPSHIAPACGLTGALAEALGALISVLDGYRLAALLAKRTEMKQLLGLRA